MAAPKGHTRYGGRAPGTPNKSTAAVKEIASSYTEQALSVLGAIMADEDAPHAARVAACREILDRACGRPSISLDVGVQQVQRSKEERDAIIAAALGSPDILEHTD